MKHFRGIIAVLLFVPLCLCFQLRFKGRLAVKVSLSKRYVAGIRSWAGCSRTELRFSDTNESEESHTSDNTETNSEPENNDGSDTTQLSGEKELEERLAESIPKDPKMVAIKELEMKLREELNSAESLLRAERIQLSKTKESVFESGKNGYFMVQAQVNDFVRRKDAEQKTKIDKNKREVVTKLIPILDAFREVPMKFPATTDREKKMHDDFNVLLRSILIALQKYGYSEYSAETGDEFRQDKHEAVEFVSGDNDISTIVHVVRQGILDSEGLILRKAQVIATERKMPEEAKNEENSQMSSEEIVEEIESSH